MIKKVIFVWLLLAGALIAADQPPKPGTFYKFNQLGIRKTEIKGKKIHLTFKPQRDDFYWCPGIKVKVTKKATIVTFVRCKTSKNCPFDQKVAIGNKLVRTVTIDTKGQDTYVRNGAKEFKKIFSGPKKSEETTVTKAPASKKTSKTGKKSSTSTSKGGTPAAARLHSMRPQSTPPARRPATRTIINKFVPSSK